MSIWGNQFFSDLYDDLGRAYRGGEKIVGDIARGVKDATGAIADGAVKSVQWIWEALQGDFSQERTAAQIAADAVLGIVPIVDQVLDVRDLIANCLHINKNTKDVAAWTALGLTLIGFIPGLGSIFKGVFKIILLSLRKMGGSIDKALSFAVKPIKSFLSDPKVVKLLKLPSYQKCLLEVVDKLKIAKGYVNTAKLTSQFQSTLNDMVGLINKVKYVAPKRVVSWLDNSLVVVKKVQKLADSMLAPALKPIQKIIDDIIAFLEKEAKGGATKATTNTRTIHTAKSAVTDVDPKILTRMEKGLYGEIISDEFMRSKGHKQLLAEGRYVRSLQDKPKGRGIDGVYENALPPPKYIITETKFRTNSGKYIDDDGVIKDKVLGDADYGKQMSDKWILYHTQQEFGKNSGISNSILKKDYLSILMLVDENGKIVAANKVLDNGVVGSMVNLDTMRVIK